jgi:hypothetical protein
MIINKTTYHEKCEWCGALGPGCNTLHEAECAADDEGWDWTETVHGQEVFACPYCLKELQQARKELDEYEEPSES